MDPTSDAEADELPAAPRRRKAATSVAERRRAILEAIRDLDLNITDARAAGQFGAANVAVLKRDELQAESVRLTRTLKANRARDPERRLEALIKIAADEGGWTAVTKMQAELRAVREEKERARREAEASWDSMEPTELLEEIIDAVAALPAELVEPILRVALQRYGMDPDEILDIDER